MGIKEHTGEYLEGKLLVAMPGMRDPRFSQSVVYICAHNEDGAMGLANAMLAYMSNWSFG